MIEILNSKRMTILIVVLIFICAIIIVIEEWFANNQLTVTSDISINKKNSPNPNLVKFANNFSLNVDIINLSDIKPVEHNTNWRHFLTFLSFTSLCGSLSGLFVRYRQKQLRHKSIARFKNQNKSDDSCHALIDMSNH